LPPDGPTADPVELTHPDLGATATSDELHRPDAPEALPPATNRYQFLEVLAEGGMGIVYRATDTALGREVAIKVLQRRFPLGSLTAQRFLDEARIAGQLQHPGIPAVHDLDTLSDGRPFLVMKLIKGRTLADLLSVTPAEHGRLVAVFEQVCQAVAYAHDHGVIHRDLKPANVMVGTFGEVQVMDWGLAKVLTAPAPDPEPGASDALERTEIRTLREANSATQTGTVLGTPAFMAPEQAGGEVARIDARTDVFGLGAVLCAILTGKPPYCGPDAEAIRLLAIRGQTADAFARLDACRADPELVALCKQCLAPDRDARPRDARAVAAVIAGHLSATEQRIRRAELDRVRADGERAKAEATAAEVRKRGRVQIALVVAVGFLVLGAGAGAWWQDKQTTRRRTEAENRDRDERERWARNADSVSALLGRCEDALRDHDAARAGLTLEQAEARAGEGGADQVSDRLARCRTDLAVLRELDRIDDLRWEVVKGKIQGNKRAASEWPLAFAKFGIVPGSPDGAAARVNGSLVRDRLLAGLDQWLAQSRSPDLLAILRAADPDPFRNAVRSALVAADDALVGELASRPAALEQPARFATALGTLETVRPDRRRQLLIAALDRRPGEFTLLMTLGRLSPIETAETARERETWYRAAVAVRSGNVVAWNRLGIALLDKGDLDGAVAAYQESIRLDSKYALVHSNLGVALERKGNLDGAVAAFQEALRLDPNDAAVHYNLGVILKKKGDLSGAVAAYETSIRLDPNSAWVHHNLGLIWLEKGELDRAVRAFEAARRLDRGQAVVHRCLGITLWAKRDLNGAIAAFKDALALNPKDAEAAGWLRQLERGRELLPRLEDIAAGRAAPTNSAEAVELAEFCTKSFMRRYTLAIRLYATAFAGDPDAEVRHRYNAARAAARVATGADADLTDFGTEEWGHVTGSAYRWLRADLAACALRAREPQQRAHIRAKLAHWKWDPDLIAVRDPAWLAAMPEGDRQRWSKLWTDVDTLLATVTPDVAPPPREVGR
jgi:tetratricopeptide (TPR) repeat protein